MDDFLSVETSSKNARKQYSVEKKYFPCFWRTRLFILGMFCNLVRTTIALSRAQEKGQNTNVRLFSVKAIDYSIG